MSSARNRRRRTRWGPRSRDRTGPGLEPQMTARKATATATHAAAERHATAWNRPFGPPPTGGSVWPDQTAACAHGETAAVIKTAPQASASAPRAFTGRTLLRDEFA